MEILELIKEEAKTYFFNAPGSHDWDHVMRVFNMAVHIAEKEGADIEIVQYAALLHDLSRQEEDSNSGRTNHAEDAKEIAEQILMEHGISNEKIDKVLHCIESHRYRGNIKPATKEAKVLFDADKLDAIGAVGIGRAFHFAGDIKAKFHNSDKEVFSSDQYSKDDTAYREYMVKLRHVRERMQTAEGKRIAEGRHHFMVEFFERLKREVEGEL